MSELEQYRARPDEWEIARMRAGRRGYAYASIILELRARVKALEAAHQPAAPATDSVVKDSLSTADDLVRRVARAIFEAPSECGWENEAPRRNPGSCRLVEGVEHPFRDFRVVSPAIDLEQAITPS